MRFLYDNEMLNGTIAATTENANYPIENLQDEIVAKYYRSTADSAQRIVLSGSSITASYIVIFSHNITSGATIKIEGNDTDSWGSPSFSESITHSTGTMIHAFTEDSYNYWSLYVDDGSNPDTYIQIGMIYLSTYLQMPVVAPGATLGNSTTAKVTISGSGQAYGDLNYEFRRYEFECPVLTDTERQSLRTMWETMLNVHPLVCLIWEDELDDDTPIYCVIDQSEINYKKSISLYKPWATNIKIREVF